MLADFMPETTLRTCSISHADIVHLKTPADIEHLVLSRLQCAGFDLGKPIDSENIECEQRILYIQTLMQVQSPKTFDDVVGTFASPKNQYDFILAGKDLTGDTEACHTEFVKTECRTDLNNTEYRNTNTTAKKTGRTIRRLKD